jgi:hypothetical protein
MTSVATEVVERNLGHRRNGNVATDPSHGKSICGRRMTPWALSIYSNLLGVTETLISQQRKIDLLCYSSHRLHSTIIAVEYDYRVAYLDITANARHHTLPFQFSFRHHVVQNQPSYPGLLFISRVIMMRKLFRVSSFGFFFGCISTRNDKSE